jgi:hypothetical protein
MQIEGDIINSWQLQQAETISRPLGSMSHVDVSGHLAASERHVVRRWIDNGKTLTVGAAPYASVAVKVTKNMERGTAFHTILKFSSEINEIWV